MSTENKTVADLLAFVEREGMVLESARHLSVPNLVDYIASERVEGSWWGQGNCMKVWLGSCVI